MTYFTHSLWELCFITVVLFGHIDYNCSSWQLVKIRKGRAVSPLFPSFFLSPLPGESPDLLPFSISDRLHSDEEIEEDEESGEILEYYLTSSKKKTQSFDISSAQLVITLTDAVWGI